MKFLIIGRVSLGAVYDNGRSLEGKVVDLDSEINLPTRLLSVAIEKQSVTVIELKQLKDGVGRRE